MITADEAVRISLLTLRVSVVATAAILVPGVLLGWALARGRFRGKAVLQTMVTLPMVLPPVAVGLVLLEILSRHSPVGRAVEAVFGAPILLTWWAAAAASAVMSLPLLVLGAQQGFGAVPRRLEHVAESLGASRARVFFGVTLPLARRGILHGLVFAFARGLGEFGATALVAGNVPGRTETLSLAIYARIEAFQDHDALVLAGIATVLALCTTGFAEAFLKPPAS